MLSDIVKGIASYETALQFLTGISEGARSLTACRGGRKHLLLSAPPCSESVAHARVVGYIKALVVIAIVDGRRREALEAIDYHHRLSSCTMIEHTEFLSGETLATSIDG